MPFPDDELTLLIKHGRDREAAELASRRLAPTTRGDAPMDPRDQLAEILPLVCELVAALDESQLAAPTACADFRVQGVLEHMVGGASVFAAAFRGETPPESAPAADVRAAFPNAMAALRDAIDSPGALDRTIAAPFGQVSGETFARFVAMDGLVHGWDIATATGQRYAPRDEVVAAVDAFARVALTDDLRDGDTFAEAVAPPAGASGLERVVAFTGRRL
jgi:uncharacterized protein (TIGR03086 family)